jgi:hypothetical protein
LLYGCHIDATGQAVEVNFNARAQNHQIVNCIIRGGTTLSASFVNITTIFYNNTVVMNHATQKAAEKVAGATASAMYMKNNIFQNDAAGGCLTGTLPTNTAANITSDTTSPESGLRSITIDFVDKAGGNYALASTDTEAIDDGSDLSADGQYAFSTDIAGTTRSGTWDIGAHEYAATPTITDIDTDETIVPGQTAIAITGSALSSGTAARLVTGNKSTPMLNYASSATAPTCDMPSLATVLAAGLKFGTATFEIVN